MVDTSTLPRLSDSQLQEARDVLPVLQARVDFASFCEYVHERPLFAHQRLWADELQREGARSLIVAPPGSLKSTTVSYYLEWCVGRDPDFTALYLMNTAEQARSKVAAIADTLEHSVRYHQVFPGVVPDKPRGWSHDRLFVTRSTTNNPDATVYGTGFDGPYQGVHVHMILVDDPTDQQDVYSESTMRQQRDRAKGVILDRLLPGGSIIGILTRWGINDLTRDFQQMGLTLIENPVVGDYPWGDLLCPQLFSREVLEQIRLSKGDGLYAMTYLCDPAILARQVMYFDVDALIAMKKDLQEPVEVLLGGLHRIWSKAVVGGRYVLGADTAWGQTGSYNVAVVLDWVTGAQVAELRGRPHPDEMALEIITLHKMYNHAYMGIERAGVGVQAPEGVVVAEKVEVLLRECACKQRMFYSDWETTAPTKPGWQTDPRTRPIMLERLAEAVRNREVVIRSRETQGEMGSFTRDEHGRPAAASGAYDDGVMASAIALAMRGYAQWRVPYTGGPVYERPLW